MLAASMPALQQPDVVQYHTFPTVHVISRVPLRIVKHTIKRVVERTFKRTLKRILKRIVKYIVKRIHEQNFKRTLNCIVQCVFLECDFQLILAEPFIDPSFIKHTNIFHYFKRTSQHHRFMPSNRVLRGSRRR
ncbi:hypothetical protein HBI12_185280 [Parastagonospora nodorum]|nr:hypothetical protein HBI12_185280 [Parastagonospora nodorum]KAH6081028.1 hypothetical protein HBI66_067850 [Parastagonospora nodorum]